jgi:zinc protease
MNTPKAMWIAAALAAMALAAPAQQAKPWEQIPTPKLHAFHPQQPKRIELPNGVVLLLQEDHELPFVHGSVLVPGGAREIEQPKAGLVQLLSESWRTSGTAKNDGDALDDLLEAKAAHIEVNAGAEAVVFSWDSLKKDSDQVFALATDLLFHPKFNEARLQLAKQRMAAGIVRRNDDSDEIAGRESAKLVYGVGGPYTHQPELSTLAAVKLQDLEAWHKRIVGGKLIVGVSGDFDSTAMEAKLRTVFGALPQAQPLPARRDTFNDPKPGVYFIHKEDVNQSNIQIVGLGTDRHNPDTPALAVMNEILGGGFASRLFQDVRTRQGLAYAVGGGLGFSWDHPGLFRVEALTKSDSTVDATKAALAQIAGMAANPPTQAEVDRAKDTILSSFLFRYDSKEKLLSESMRLEFYGYPANYLATYEAQLKAVQQSDVAAVAKKYLHPEKLAILVVGNPSELKPGLDELKLGPVQTIDITIPQPAAKANAGTKK